MINSIVVFSGSRSEYSLLKPILSLLKSSTKFKITLVLANSHFQKKFGFSYDKVDKKDIYEIKKILPPIENQVFNEKNNIKIISELTLMLKKINPKYFVVYGDRHETFTAVFACSFLKIPIVHIEGGDITNGGTKDDLFRHAITKLSHLHFVTNKNSYKNILSLGEEKWRVRHFGLPSIEKIKKNEISNYSELKIKYKLNNNKKFIIFTIHPLPNNLNQTKLLSKISIDVVKEISKEFNVIFTYPNNDEGNKIIIKKINDLRKQKNKNITIVENLGEKDYFGFLSLNKKSDFYCICAGNSSSGIKEAISFNCPSINIGTRQNGRFAPRSVFDVGVEKSKIINLIKKLMFSKIIWTKIKKIRNPYYKKNTCVNIVNYLYNKSYDKQKLLLKIHR